MKKIIWLLLAALAFQDCSGQIFKTYKGKLRRAERVMERDTNPIHLDPIETVPEKTPKKLSAEAVTNWGVDYLRNASIVARIASECTRPVTIKIADTAFDWNHNDLTQAELPGSNYTTDPNRVDQNGHSTHVAGIIAAKDFGLAWPLVQKGLLKIKPVGILNGSGSGDFTWFANSVAGERADDQARLNRGESVVWSGSFGGGTSAVESVESQLKASTDLGIIFVFAAGNTGVTGVNYPGNSKYAIACGSLDQGLTVSSYSTRGPEVWAGMPGRSINSTYKDNTYAILSGTSMATPFLSASCGIALSKWGRDNLKNYTQMRAYLAWCANDLPPNGKDNDTGYGIELITNILDRNPKDTPGTIPVDPPPPPPGPTPHDQRFITLNFDDGFDVYWNIVQSGQRLPSTPVTFKTAGKGSKKTNQNLALTRTKITSLTVEVDSRMNIDDETAQTHKAVVDFFTNRAFGLLPGMDDADAAYWAGYFLEMILQQAGTKVLDVTDIKANSSKGVKVFWSNGRLKHWPLKV